MQNVVVRTVMAIALGAIPGALGRYLITEFTKTMVGKDFSYYGTFLINVTGCFVLALFYTLSEEKFRSLSPEIRLAIATGLCGAYTTFSTYGLDTFTQLDEGNITGGLIYWLASMIFGMLAVQLGVTLGKLRRQS